MLAGLLFVVLGLVVAVAQATTKVLVTAHYPRSLPSLYLRGDNCGLDWNKGAKMAVSSENGHYRWTIDLQCESGGEKNSLEMKVLIGDETWMLGSNHHVSVSDSVGSSSVDMYPWFYTYEGALNVISHVYSPELKNYRDVIVYTPPSYTENTLKVHSNVLVMHDGQNLFNPQTSAFGTAWMCQDTVDQMVISGKSDEMVIVGPYNTNDRTNEYTYIYDPSEQAGGKGDLYLDWLESTLLPLAQKNFRVNIQRDTLGIMGSSLGGLISCYAGWTRANIYGKVGCMSSSFWWDDNNFQKDVIVQRSINDTLPVPVFYMDSGTAGGDGSCAVYTAQVYDYYLQHGFTADSTVFKYIDEGGEHNEASWGRRFSHPIEALYPSTTV